MFGDDLVLRCEMEIGIELYERLYECINCFVYDINFKGDVLVERFL